MTGFCHVFFPVLAAVERINAAIRAGVPEKTVEELMNPEAQLPTVYPEAADLYQKELSSLQQQSPEVSQGLELDWTSSRPDQDRPEPDQALNYQLCIKEKCLFHWFTWGKLTCYQSHSFTWEKLTC